MIAAKFDPEPFFQRTDNVALHVPASELFGFLKRSLDLPIQWAALISRTTGDHEVVRPGGSVSSDDAQAVMFVRVTPVDVSFVAENLASRDGFACKAEVKTRLAIIPERGEMLSFQQHLLGSRRVAQAEGLASYLQPSLHAGLAKLAAEQDAAALVDARTSDAVSTALADAVEPACFAAGLVLERRPTARFESSALRQVQQVQQTANARRAEHEAARQLDEALQKARTEHVDQLASLLTRLNELAAASPDVKLPDLLRTFSEGQRGQLYEALFATEEPTTRTQWLVVAAAEELLFFDPQALDSPSRRLKIDGEAGAARSVQMGTLPQEIPLPSRGEGRVGGESEESEHPTLTPTHSLEGRGSLLVGAATGVYLWPIDLSTPEVTFLVSGASRIRGGFNAAVLAGDRLFATHSELGIHEWDLGEPTSGKPRFASMTAGAKAVRDVEFFDGDLYCSIDDRIIRWPVDDATDRPRHIYTGSDSLITALCPTADGLFAGNSDGDILQWPGGRDTEPEVLCRGQKRAAESIWLLSSHGVRRLIFTDTSHRVHAKVLGDSFECNYEAGGQTLRRVEVAPDLIVATTELRDRLICWKPGNPEKPFATVALASLTGRSVQDVCLVPAV